jgi:hypothetical protein
MRAVLAVYVAGLLVGLLRVDAGGLKKLGLALAWPLGVLAAVLTTPVLLTTAAIRFPWFGVVMLAGAVGLGWWMVH